MSATVSNKTVQIQITVVNVVLNFLVGMAE